MAIQSKNLLSGLKSVADKGKAQSVVLGVLFLGLTVLEEYYVEEVFICRCFDTRGTSIGISAAFILGSTLIVFLTSFGLMQASRIVCSKKREEEYEKTKSHPSVSPGQGETSRQLLSAGDTPDQGDTPGQDKKVSKSTGEPCTYIYHGFSKKKACKNLKMSLFSVAGWFVVICIDGDYGACLSTLEPYGDFDCSNFTASAPPPFSETYERKKRIFQYVGIALIIACAAFFGITRALCCSCGRGCKCVYTTELDVDGKNVGEVLKELAPIAQPIVESGARHATTALRG